MDDVLHIVQEVACIDIVGTVLIVVLNSDMLLFELLQSDEDCKRY